MLKRSILAAAVCLSMLAASSPVQPSNPIQISVEAGSCAGVYGKVDVSAHAQITKKGVSFSTEVIGHDIGLTSATLDEDSVDQLMAALSETLARPDESFKKTLGDLIIDNSEKDGKRIICITKMRRTSVEGLIAWDLDNAQQFVTLLNRSKGIQQWLKTRIDPLQK